MVTTAAYQSSSTFEPILDLDILYGVVAMMCFVVGTIGNLLSFRYFILKKKDLATIIYCFITIADLIVSILMLPTGVSFLNKREATLLSNTIICNIHGIVWYITSKLTIYLVAVLCITRTTYLVYPFYRINKKIVVASIVLYLIYLLVPATITFWYQERYYYSKWYVACVFSTPGLSLLFINLQYTVPIFPILSSCIISGYALMRHPAGYSLQSGMDLGKKSSTITIVWFTLVYCLFNIPVCVMWIMLTIDYYSGWKYRFFAFDLDGFYFDSFIAGHSVALNSALNPLLYFWRMKLFREHTTNLIGQCVSRGTSTVLWLEEHMTASTVQQSERSVEGHTFSNDNTESQSVRIDRGKEEKTVQQIE